MRSRTSASFSNAPPPIMVLDAATLARSIVTPGSAEAWAPVFSRLDAGEPIVVGVFGASVAQVQEHFYASFFARIA